MIITLVFKQIKFSDSASLMILHPWSTIVFHPQLTADFFSIFLQTAMDLQDHTQKVTIDSKSVFFVEQKISFLINFSNNSYIISESNIYHPCPQPFYFATNSTQYLPAFRLGFLQTCIFSINSTQEIRLKINRVNKTSNFGIKVL